MRRLMTWWILRNKTCSYCEEAPATMTVVGRSPVYNNWRSLYGCAEHAHSARYWSDTWLNPKEYNNGI